MIGLFLMIVVTVMLWRQIKLRDSLRDILPRNGPNNSVVEVKWTLAILLLLFELGNGSRIAWETSLPILNNGTNKNASFHHLMMFELVYFIEGFTFSGILIFHHKNFKPTAVTTH